VKAATASLRGQMGGFALIMQRFPVTVLVGDVVGTVALATLGRRLRRGRNGLVTLSV